jgi:hypothetical protein
MIAEGMKRVSSVSPKGYSTSDRVIFSGAIVVSIICSINATSLFINLSKDNKALPFGFGTIAT